MTSSGLFSSGDYMIQSYTADNSYTNPNFQSSLNSVGADGADGTDYGFYRVPSGLSRKYSIASGVLEAGDFTDNNTLTLTQVDQRTGVRPTIVVNAVVPEPGLFLLGIGMGSILVFRRRQN